MKTLGLIGGMSWESTSVYYRLINTHIREALGGLHSAKLVIHSADFALIAAMQAASDWAGAGEALAQAGRGLKAAGAQALLICTNTMHKVADAVQNGSSLPLLHIIDCTADAVTAHGLTRVGVLGTRFTMEEPFYREHLARRGIEALAPEEADRATVHRVIYEQLCRGIVSVSSRRAYEDVMRGLAARGAQAMLLACTEIALLLPDAQFEGLPLFDTTRLHAAYAARYALS